MYEKKKVERTILLRKIESATDKSDGIKLRIALI